MATLLHIQASPRERSHSRAVAKAFIDSYIDTHQEDLVRTIDVFETELFPFDGLVLQAKYNILNGQPHTDEQLKAWQQVERIIADFMAADKYLWSLPMWNFGIPYRLKHYLDILVQPGYTFGHSPERGFYGLITGKPALLICARGGTYKEGDPSASMDFQKTYMELILRFMGFEDIRSVLIEPTLGGGPDAAKRARETAIEEARKMARGF